MLMNTGQLQQGDVAEMTAFLLDLGVTTVKNAVPVFQLRADGDYDGLMTVGLYHALDAAPEGEFAERGRVTVQSLHGEASVLQQGTLSLPDRHRLKDLAKEDGIYRLKAVVKTVDGKETPFLTFVKACSLVESRLSDTVTLSLDHSGTVIAVTLSTNALCQGSYVDLEDIRQFNTSVAFKHTEQGPVPDTATYIQKMEREREARERGETKDNRSFLAKYWMYIVPVLIFVLLSGAVNPEGAAAGGGGGGSGGGGR